MQASHTMSAAKPGALRMLRSLSLPLQGKLCQRGIGFAAVSPGLKEHPGTWGQSGCSVVAFEGMDGHGHLILRETLKPGVKRWPESRTVWHGAFQTTGRDQWGLLSWGTAP